MKRYVTPSRVCRSTSRFRIAACTDTSSAEVGSSQTTTCGSPAKARAMATRCLRPPESWVGRSGRCRSSIRTELISSTSRACSASPERPASRCSARPTSRRTLWRRLSAESGFWNTIWSDFTCSRVRPRASPATGDAPELDLASPDRERSGRAGRARGSSCRCPTRPPARASRRG